MATRRYKASPGTKPESVVEEAGAAANSHIVELTVDLDSALVNDNGTTRAIKKSEVLEALDKIKQTIEKGNWPPA